jgi:hypothetical protein
VNGSSESDQIEELSPSQQLLSGNNPASVVKDLLEKLGNDETGEHTTYEQGDYYVFEWEADSHDGEGLHEKTVYTYFDLATYELDRQKLTFGDEPNRYDLTTYLVHEYLPVEQAEEIFDPSKYNLVAGPELSVGGYNLTLEEGCYLGNEKLSDEKENALLESLPESALEEWNEMFETVKGGSDFELEDLDALEEVEVWTESELPKDMSFIKPTEGIITQGFHAGHYAYDIANSEQPDILAAADGTIVYASTGIWDGGYGDNIWIEHDNGYRTHYAHMEEIYVNVGDTVTKGQPIGKMGNTGRVYGPTGIALHFELEYNGTKVDPSIMNVW